MSSEAVVMISTQPTFGLCLVYEFITIFVILVIFFMKQQCPVKPISTYCCLYIQVKADVTTVDQCGSQS